MITLLRKEEKSKKKKNKKKKQLGDAWNETDYDERSFRDDIFS